MSEIPGWTTKHAGEVWREWRRRFDTGPQAAAHAICAAGRLVVGKSPYTQKKFNAIRDEFIRRNRGNLVTGWIAQSEHRPCWRCNRTGRIKGQTCFRCGGDGEYDRVLYGHRFRLSGRDYDIFSHIRPGVVGEKPAEPAECESDASVSALLKLLSYVAAAIWKLNLDKTTGEYAPNRQIFVDATLYFDGACEPVNPGGHVTWGFVLHLPDEDDVKYGYLGHGEGMTSNVAEWVALGKGLRHIADSRLLVRRLSVRGDSKLVINQLTGEWNVNAEHLRKYRDRCLELLEEIGCEWNARWIPREENERADELSRRAYVSATGKEPPVRC